MQPIKQDLLLYVVPIPLTLCIFYLQIFALRIELIYCYKITNSSPYLPVIGGSLFTNFSAMLLK